MEITRNLKRGMTGADVQHVNRILACAGYLEPDYAYSDVYTDDTYVAVKVFQTDTGVKSDGIVGPVTWAKLATFEVDNDADDIGPGCIEDCIRLLKDIAAKHPELALSIEQVITFITSNDDEAPAKPHNALDLPNIGVRAAKDIALDLADVSATRRAVVLGVLPFAYDPDVSAEYPWSLYNIGGNLYDTDLSLHCPTADYIRREAKSSSHSSYYTNGRADMMIAAIEACPGISASDCSGGVVGIWRKLGLQSPSFDTTANGLCGGSYSTSITKGDLEPGDLVGYDGHVGIYAGAGYVVEWMGGAYGCQLTKLDDRRGWDFVNKKSTKKTAWSKYRRPKCYKD